MLRPLSYSTRRGDADISETLQSDVMRFIAIMSLCLVAIFALVQTLPLRPTPVSEVTTEPTTTDAIESTESQSMSIPVASSESTESIQSVPSPPTAAPELTDPISIPAPEPPRASQPLEQVQTPEQRGEPVKPISPVDTPPVPTKHDSPAVTPPTKAATATAGLSLRFASDNALLALVAQRRVEVYAQTDSAAWLLSSSRGMLTFSATAAPKQFHPMSEDTVPNKVADTLIRDVSEARSSVVTFAVTLPSTIARQLKNLVNEHKNGLLVIHADGRVEHQGAD